MATRRTVAARTAPTARTVDGRQTALAQAVADGGLPRLPRVHIPRRRLSERLETASHGAFTVVVAPSGAGKTLGVAGWLHETGRTDETLWVTATGDLDAERLGELLESTRESNPASDARFRRLVIDDAHRLPRSAVACLDRELNTRPDGLDVVLMSQCDLPLSSLVPELLGHLTVLRGGILRLDEQEATALVIEHARTDSPAAVEAIAAHAQGWCAPLVLIAKAVATEVDPVKAVAGYAAGVAGVVTQVANEVLTGLQPRERHVLLCLAGEGIVTADTATHLTGDPDAGDLLAGLEATGLLVTRVADLQPSDTDGSDVDGAGEGGVHFDAAYRIHPILVQSARRRLLEGGTEAENAKTQVLHAVRADLAGGSPELAFARTVAIDDPVATAEILGAEGPRLLLRGHATAIHAFARRHPDLLGDHRDAWLTLAIGRWLAGDTISAVGWMNRWLSHVSDPGAARDPAAACVSLMRARLGLEPIEDALELAVHAERAAERRAGTDALYALLLLEMGATESWLGRLADAEVHLTSAVLLARAQDLPAVTVQALSHLALTEFMQGREHTALKVAAEAGRGLADRQWQPVGTAARIQVTRDIALSQGMAWSAAALGDGAGRRASLHPGDLPTRYWARILDARWMLLRGDVTEAERILDEPWEGPTVPRHLRAAAFVERALQATVASDRDTLTRLVDDLEGVGAAGEAAFVAGLRADLVGDARRAQELFARAASTATLSQPAVVPMARTCRAQLLDSLGHSGEALDELRSAMTATEVRRNMVAFLGWSRLGTPVRLLLTRAAADGTSRWCAELEAANHPGVAASLGPVTATPHERSHTSDTVVRPMLTPREREVLLELARGATYADISASLTVTENTVKTHVSSLYAKLAVSRRSDALAVARTLRLV